MASWCAICRCKLKPDYIYYKGKKIHKKCKPKKKGSDNHSPSN